jgi:hypothetical protein
VRVEAVDLGLVIAGQAGLVGNDFEVGIVAVRRGGEQRLGQQGAVPAASGAVPVVALVQEIPSGVVLPGRSQDPGEVDACGRGHAGVAAPDGRLDREGQGLAGGLKLAGLMPAPAEAGQVVGGLAFGILAGQDAFSREPDERMSYLERLYSDTDGLGRHSGGSSR